MVQLGAFTAVHLERRRTCIMSFSRVHGMTDLRVSSRIVEDYKFLSIISITSIAREHRTRLTSSVSALQRLTVDTSGRLVASASEYCLLV